MLISSAWICFLVVLVPRMSTAFALSPASPSYKSTATPKLLVNPMLSLKTTSATAESQESSPPPSTSNDRTNDIYIVGCGTLGSIIGAKWRELYPSAWIVGETYGESRHTRLIESGITPVKRQDRANLLREYNQWVKPNSGSIQPGMVEKREEELSNSLATAKFPNVVFCVPPSKFQHDEYAEEMENVIQDCWEGRKSRSVPVSNSNKAPTGGVHIPQMNMDGGGFVFTSSGSVFRDPHQRDTATQGEISLPSRLYYVNEDSEVDTTSRNAAKILSAEQVALRHQGAVIRFAGLYTVDKGAHAYWLNRAMKHGASDAPPIKDRDGLINLIHYEDAAEAVIKLLQYQKSQRAFSTVQTDTNNGENNNYIDNDGDVNTSKLLFIASDNEPITRYQICEATLSNSHFQNCEMPSFEESYGIGQGEDSRKVFLEENEGKDSDLPITVDACLEESSPYVSKGNSHKMKKPSGEDALLAFGKIYDDSRIRKLVKWAPRHAPSFRTFMRTQKR